MSPRAGIADSTCLARSLRHAILEGKYATGEPFPSIRDLAREHQVGLWSARMATDLLAKEGLLLRRKRSTFVRSAAPRRPEDVGARLACVNILERPIGTLPAFVRMHYLQGHTLALDANHIRMRVMPLPSAANAIPGVLSDQYPLREQGCILVNILDRDVLAWFRENQVPFVVQNYRHYLKDALPPHHSVVVNKLGGAFMAVRRLIELGHRRIGYVGRQTQEDQTVNEVFEGFTAAMRCSGLEARASDLIDFHTDDPATAHVAARPFIKGRELPTAIVAQTDSVALGIVKAARSLGMRVPEDLSVVGFNDQAEATQCDPPLTTVAVPRVQLGREAVETLLSVADGVEREPVSKVLECHLVERGSTGGLKVEGERWRESVPASRLVG